MQHVIDGLERREKQTDGSSPAQPCQHYTGAPDRTQERQEMEKRVGTSQAKPLGIQPLGHVDRSFPSVSSNGENCTPCSNCYTQTQKTDFLLVSLAVWFLFPRRGRSNFLIFILIKLRAFFPSSSSCESESGFPKEMRASSFDMNTSLSLF